LVTLILVGMPGSGKDVFVQSALSRGFSHIRMGDVVRAFAKEAGLGSDDSSIGGFASSERQIHDDSIWAERTLKRMPEGDVLIDGSRSLAEIERFRKILGDGLKVIGIHAPEEQRFRRLVARGRPDDPDDRVKFNNRDRRELGWGLRDALDVADISIDNDGSLEEFRAKCLDVLDRLLNGDRKTI
jgi:dephospho-CoA kinase